MDLSFDVYEEPAKLRLLYPGIPELMSSVIDYQVHLLITTHPTMPPRLQLLSRPQPLLPFLYPSSITNGRRSVSILTSLSDNPGAYNKRIRRGRGPSSGKGKTSGRGHKGQGQRKGVPAGFEGGQTPAHIVAGERGFDNVFSAELSPVNLNRVQQWIDKGRLPKAGEGVVTVRELVKSRCIHGTGKDGVKLLARGLEELRDPVNFVVSRASKAAIDAVEKAGGSVVTRYYSPFATAKVLRGEMDPIHSLASRIQISGKDGGREANVDWAARAEDLVRNKNGYQYRLPDPLSRKALEYYRDSAKRGYLSYQVPEGESPSLFFKTPTDGIQKRTVRKAGTSGGRTNKLW